MKNLPPTIIFVLLLSLVSAIVLVFRGVDFLSSRRGTIITYGGPFPRTVAGKVEEFRIVGGRIPTQEEGLEALVSRPVSVKQWSQLYNKVPLDPWGNQYCYVVDSKLPRGFGVFSCGPDGISLSEGNDEDDQNSWTRLEFEREPRGFFQGWKDCVDGIFR